MLLRVSSLFLLALGAAFNLPAVDFSADVQPIFKAKCYACHGGAQTMSGLRLDAKAEAMKGGYSGQVIVPGNSSESKLLHRVAGAKGVAVMPPGTKGLSPQEVTTLRMWIDQGAPWPDALSSSPAKRNTSVEAGPVHWAFRPIRHPDVPATGNASWAVNPIDKFVLSRLEREKVAPSPEADKRTLLRRVSLDLTGLPPTGEELELFLADRSPSAYERAVQRLLSSPHFGERWARPWLDRARYADSDGYEKDWVRPYAWRWRNWVIDALNSDMPFDRFSVEQIAGDLLPSATTEQLVATGFHRNTLTNREGGIDNKQFEFEAAIDRTNTVAATWLGLTMGCAQCHDHKYDPVSQKDYYSLFAFFENVEEVDRDAPLPGELGPYLRGRDEYRRKRTELLEQYKVPELQPAWEKQMLEASANPGKRTDWDLAWDCLLKLTEGGDGEKIMRIPAEKRTERERNILTDHFVRNFHFAVGPKVYAEVKFKELDGKLRDLYKAYPQLTQAMTIGNGPSAPSFLRVRGDYRTNGIEVQAASPAVLPGMKTGSAKATRLDLANWIVSPENPLPARVTVNWVWQELFGKGLVRTPDDFGTRAEAPSHPELLDFLAAGFIENGWSMKQLIRTIVTSATYKQSSNLRPDLQNSDPDNRLLARQARLRLPAELIRDSALSVAGLLSPEIGGKSVFPPQPKGVVELGYGSRGTAAWPESVGKDRYRRGLYIHFQRSTPYPMLVNFDAPKASVAVCKREASNTPLQALNLLNDPAFMEAAESLAYRALMASMPSFEQRLFTLSELALGRRPNEREAGQYRRFFDKQKAIFESDRAAAAELASASLSGLDKPEIAAWVSLASVVLNLDEFVTRN